jgi:hypothetical protein
MDHVTLPRRTLLTAAALLAFALPCSSQLGRSVSGTVRDKAGNVLPKAVVELENRVNLAIRSYITDAEGKYFFGDLNPDVEFTLKANYKQHWSKTETLSKFNESKHARIDLVIPID